MAAPFTFISTLGKLEVEAGVASVRVDATFESETECDQVLLDLKPADALRLANALLEHVLALEGLT